MKIKKVRVFMCGISWQHELGETDVTVYESAKALQKAHGEMFCGIVECEVKLVKWVKPQEYEKMGKRNNE